MPDVFVLNQATLPETIRLYGADSSHDASGLGDNKTDATDYNVLVTAFNGDITVPGSGYDPAADYNEDGLIDSGDFAILVNDYNGPSYVNLTGYLAVDSLTSVSSTPFLVGPYAITLRNVTTHAAVFTAYATLQPTRAGGVWSFTAQVPKGTYDVAIKGDRTLRKTLHGINATSNATIGSASAPINILTGDLNGDNSIDAGDFSLLVGSYNSDASVYGSGYLPTIDVNYDGSIDISDWNYVVVFNFGLTGDN